MMQLTFHSISEDVPGQKWQTLFNRHWSAYRAWYLSKGAAASPDLATSVENLEKYMPEMMPTYRALCTLSGNDAVAHRFLTGWQPPAYISGCSQAVNADGPMLVRNYDYHPNLCEGTVIRTKWHGQDVLGVGDCLAGLVDGVNESGLVVSLTFGGRRAVGPGFGIPFIIRYVLEFSTTLAEAVDHLCRIPCNMAYNVIVLDKQGHYSRVQLSPNDAPVVSMVPVSTNHQDICDWPEHAAFSKTVEREAHLLETLSEPGLEAESLIREFGQNPLYNTRFTDGFGTIYTAVYHPKEGSMELRWPENRLEQSIAQFSEGSLTVSYGRMVAATAAPQAEPVEAYAGADFDYSQYIPTDIVAYVAKMVIEHVGLTGSEAAIDVLGKLEKENKARGTIGWEILADMWSNVGYAKDFAKDYAAESK